jgi:hypothetical protein
VSANIDVLMNKQMLLPREPAKLKIPAELQHLERSSNIMHEEKGGADESINQEKAMNYRG